MGMDQGGDLGGGRLPVDGEVTLLEELGGPRSGGVHTEDRALPSGDNLHQPLGLADDERPAVPAEAMDRRHDVVTQLPSAQLGQAAERDFGMGIDPPGHLLVVDRRRPLAEDRLDRDHRLREPDVSELRRIDDVTDRVDAGYRRTHETVDRDEAPTVDLDARALEVDALGTGSAAD